MKFLFFVIIGLFYSLSFGQENTVFYYHIDKITLKYKVVKDSTLNYQKYEKKALTEFQLAGYTGINREDSIVKRNGTHFQYSFQAQFKKIFIHNLDEKSKKDRKSKSYLGLSQELNKKLVNLENSGFPFAQIKIINLNESEESLNIEYKLDSGLYFSLDEINIKSKKPFDKKTILNLIGLSSGDPYNEGEIKNIKDLLQATGLYSMSQPVQVLFKENGKADIYIYIDKSKSSSADGYVGFQQDQQTNKLALNGYLNLQLNNSFNRAEIIEMHWKSNPDKTQDFFGKLEYPYILNTPLGVGAQLSLRKQDSTFLRSDINLNLSYNHPMAKFTIFDQIESSSTLRESAPSEFRNYSKNTLGTSLLLKPPTLSFAAFYHPKIFLLGGFYKYRNDTIDDNKQKVSNAKYELRYEHKIDFLKYFHLNNSISLQGLTSSISLSRNELIYFGGLQTVRGFYELELYGNEAVILRNEIEFKPIDLLSMFILYDYSKFNYNGRHQTNSLGFGFGLKSKGTTLQIIVANGVLDQNSVDFSNTKIHLGFKSTF